MALMTKYDTIGETIARARRYGEKAISALDVFPDNAERRAMVDVVRFCIDRAR
jgi:octaprenyl-diphosphate synthase